MFDNDIDSIKGVKNLRVFLVNIRNFLDHIKSVEILETESNKLEYFKLNTYISKCYAIEFKILEKKINLTQETFSERQQKILDFIGVLLKLLGKLLLTLTVKFY